MNAIFINSENSKTSKAHILLLKLTNELDLRMDKKIIALLPSKALTCFYP